MRLSIRAKQIAGVTAIVGLVVVVLSALNVTRLARVGLQESEARGKLLADAIFHRVRQIVAESGDPYVAIQSDPGLLSLLQSSIYGESVTDAAILDAGGAVLAHSDSTRVGQLLESRDDLRALVNASAWDQLAVIFSSDGQTLEVRQPMMLGDEAFGSIKIGVSTLLLRQELDAAVRPALFTAAAALGIGIIVAALLAQLLLRPIHVIKSGLTRLGKGEFGVTLDLPPGDEFAELGTFFNTVSQQLSADRSELVGQKAHLQSAVEHLEDAVALFNPSGELLFSNPAMQAALPPNAIGRPISNLLPTGHPYREIVEETLASRKSRGPVQTALEPKRERGAASQSPANAGERLLLTHAISGAGVLLVARNLSYLSRMQSTIAYSRKLVALGRLTAGIAHEVKNPLNAMMIHLELLRTKLRAGAIGGGPAAAAGEGRRVKSGLGLAVAARAEAELSPLTKGALEHVQVIESEVRRLDEVVQGFLKFSRPEDLRLQPVSLPDLFEEILHVVQPEAERNKVTVEVARPDWLPAVNGDAAMLRQALLNLAINACQAMPHGGTLRLTANTASHDRVEIRVTDTGVGIAPEHLSRIFDLYFTTKHDGTGIGLSMVYRIIQLHDGDIEVESTPGRGSTFRVLLPRAHEV